MSRPKQKTSASNAGLFKADSVKDVAESLGINHLSDAIASALASDVEYRIHQVIDEASRFTKHAHRTTMTTHDIDHALRVLNIEPLYGHSPYNPPTFRRALPFPTAPSAGPVYFVEDEEIDFEKVLREEKVALPRPAGWTAHWLAVEGVQPLIPENPPAISREREEGEGVGMAALVNGVGVGVGAGRNGATPPPRNGTQFPPTPPSPSRRNSSGANNTKTSQLLVKQVLSRELQLYYTRLTSTLMPVSGPSQQVANVDESKKVAALTSLRGDAGLQTLLPYLVKWVGDGVVGLLRDSTPSEGDGKALEVYLNVIDALLDNQSLFVEPYLHQMLPPLLSILLHSSLPQSSAAHLRTTASQTLAHLLTQHSTTYPSLAPRIMKTLLLALLSQGKSKGTREGAVKGLVGVGKEAIRKGLIEGGGAKMIGLECAASGSAQENASVTVAVLDAFKALSPTSSAPRPLNPGNPADKQLMPALGSTLGPYFAARVSPDAEWARSLIAGPRDDEGGTPMEM